MFFMIFTFSRYAKRDIQAAADTFPSKHAELTSSISHQPPNFTGAPAGFPHHRTPHNRASHACQSSIVSELSTHQSDCSIRSCNLISTNQTAETDADPADTTTANTTTTATTTVEPESAAVCDAHHHATCRLPATNTAQTTYCFTDYWHAIWIWTVSSQSRRARHCTIFSTASWEHPDPPSTAWRNTLLTSAEMLGFVVQILFTGCLC